MIPLSLLCLPCAGASASMYVRWKRSLPRWIQLVPVELPGRGARMSEAFVENYEDLVERLCQEYVHCCKRRYALYGHSMGALLAYGMAMRWRSASRALPDALFVSGSPAPKHRNPDYFAGKQTDAALIADLRKQGGTPEEVYESVEMLRITLDTLRADYKVCSGYQYRETRPLALPIHAFAGRHDDIDATSILAWEAETCSRFSVRWFDGGHFFIREHEPALLRAMAEQLTEASMEGANATAVGV